MGERAYFRHRLTGDRGYLIERDGRKLIRMDTGPGAVEKNYVALHWIPDHQHQPKPKIAIARVAYEADIAYCQMMHLQRGVRRPEWPSLSRKKQMFWVDEGPKDEGRRKLWLAVMRELLPLTEGS